MAQAVAFYRTVLKTLLAGEVPFLIGGAYAFSRYTRIDRRTKDLDLMIRRDDWPLVVRALRKADIYTRLTFPHWLGKALARGAIVDIIFSGGNGLTDIDDESLVHSVPATVLGYSVRLVPPEDLIWTKAFVMERERYDGADVLHLIHALAETLDWSRLCRRFRGHEAVLLSYVLLFGYVYPGEERRVPGWVMPHLLHAPRVLADPDLRLCRGTVLSRAQFLVDVRDRDYVDARMPPFGRVTPRERRIWTRAIPPSEVNRQRARGMRMAGTGTRTRGPARRDAARRKASARAS